MKKALFVLVLAAAAFVGCQKPAEVAAPVAQDTVVAVSTMTAPVAK